MTSNDLRRFLATSKGTIRQGSPMIFSILSIIGIGVSCYLWAKKSVEHHNNLEDYEETHGEPLIDKKEKAKMFVKDTWPAIAMTGATMIGVASSNVISAKQLASATGAYALLDRQLKKYGGKVDDIFGSGSLQKFKNEVAKEIKPKNKLEYERDSNKKLFYDEYLHDYFEATEEDVLRAQYEINKRLSKFEEVTLNEWYDMLDVKPLDHGDTLGWSYQTIAPYYETTGYNWLDFDWERFDLDDGLEAIRIIYATAPSPDYCVYY